jgi:ADP-ribose pyrophosphatase YjhB (NUDIX family)
MTKRRQITAFGRLAPDTEPIGGLVRHGEHPASAVTRLAAEQAGLSVRVSRVLTVNAIVDGELHEDRVVFETHSAAPPTSSARRIRTVEGRPRVQRFAAYGVVTDPDKQVLLTRIADGYPGAGRWHLPGGGSDFGEQPTDALLRELFEETAQEAEVHDLLNVSSRHNPAALGPEGYPIDWHTVRVLYRAFVPAPDKPRVTEGAGGSTAAAGWFGPADLGVLDLTEFTRLALAQSDRAGGEGR